ncbi:GNAT family N-acetyltransferase [Yeosuana sp.]|uniref:GNAT family N-acetyltransferase n=1 Tax=Yeosuana sp. TaxID=2529388 RepID=UPI0040553158
MKNEPIMRFAEKSDLDALIYLCELHAVFEESGYDSNHKKQNLNSHLFSEQPSLFCLVVEQDKKLIGYATYMKQFSTWDADFYVYMDCLYLTETGRGFGIGEKLIKKIQEEARKNNCTHIQWQTPDFNKRAIKFYQRIGAKSKTKERFFLNASL